MPTIVRDTKLPILCTHCNKFSSRPPAWLKLLDKVAPGRGQDEPEMTTTAISRLIGSSVSATHWLVNEAVKAGVLERIPVQGAKIYRRTRYAHQILNRWYASGWKSKGGI